jgi:hypothetical protein
MRPLCTLCIVALTISTFSGCKAPNGLSESPQKDYSYSRGRMQPIELADMPEIVSSVCDQLGISITDVTEETNRYEANCTSMTGLDVNFEAIAVVKGKSLLTTRISGENAITRVLGQEISSAIHTAVRAYTHK